MTLPLPVPDRFWSKVKQTDGCWEWQGYCLPNGYGRFHWAEAGDYAHRASWILSYGDIPSGLFVLHHCDNPPCVRPDHLFLGTPLDNVNDSHRKGRRPSMTLRRRITMQDSNLVARSVRATSSPPR